MTTMNAATAAAADGSSFISSFNALTTTDGTTSSLTSSPSFIDVTSLSSVVIGIDASAADYAEFYARAQMVTGLFLYPAFCLFGLVGNCLTVIVLRGRKLRSVTSTFLIALSLSDGIKLVTDLFYFVVVLLLKTAPDYGTLIMAYMYPYAHYFFNASLCVTAWLTVSLAAERYILVCHVAHAKQWCNVGRAKITIAIVYTSMSVFSLPFALRYRTVWTPVKKQEDGGNNVETASTTPTAAAGVTTSPPIDVQYVVSIGVTELWSDETFTKTYLWTQNILRSLVPLLIMSTLNCFIVDALRRSARHVSSNTAASFTSSPHHHRARRRHRPRRGVSPRNRRVTLMLVAVIVVFIVCVTPDAVLSTFFGFGYYDAESDLVRGIREITDFLLLVNSTCNFLLYCAFNSAFRNRFRSLVVRQFGSCCCGAGRTGRNCVTALPTTTDGLKLKTVNQSPTLLPIRSQYQSTSNAAVGVKDPLSTLERGIAAAVVVNDAAAGSVADVNGNSSGSINSGSGGARNGILAESGIDAGAEGATTTIDDNRVFVVNFQSAPTTGCDVISNEPEAAGQQQHRYRSKSLRSESDVAVAASERDVSLCVKLEV